MQQITKSNDLTTKKIIINRGSDIAGGISIDLSTLTAGKIIQEATPVSAPTSGLRKICKQAVILTGSTTTAVKVATATNPFKVGDFIGVKTAGKAYAITSITTSNGVDTLNVGTAIDAVTTGAFVYEMTAEATTNTSVLKNTAVAILKKYFVVPTETQVIFVADAFIEADVLDGYIGSEYLSTMKKIGVIVY